MMTSSYDDLAYGRPANDMVNNTHRCNDCDEDIVGDSSVNLMRYNHGSLRQPLSCPQCGGVNLTSLNENDHNNNNNINQSHHGVDHGDFSNNGFDLLNNMNFNNGVIQPRFLDDDMLAHLFEVSQNNVSKPATSKEFIESMLAPVNFDQVCLEDINVGGVRRTMFASGADFGRVWVVNDERVSGELIEAVPIFGGDEPINGDEWKDRIVVMKRGEISFSDKANVAQSLGAVGVVVIQTKTTWPYRMTDSVKRHKIEIPVCMISSKDGESLLNVLRLNSEKSVATSCSLTTRQRVSGCPVCRDDFHAKSEVLTLPCWHQYCRECLVPWLQSNNTCPLCRFELPTERPPSVSPPEQQSANQRTLHHSMFT